MTSRSGSGLKAAFYGDDFTGSTDSLTQFHRVGLRSVLLFDCPRAEEVRRLARTYDVVGVAGVGRSLRAEAMEEEIGPALEALRAGAPRLVQYKMCSTADSSPDLGSLGRAIEIGQCVFGERPVPILAAQPEFGRYTAFGNHFATDRGAIHRLDRQPTMSQHPSTPMTEADLRVHIGRQTSLPIASLDLTAYELSTEVARRRYGTLLAREPGAIVFDAVSSPHTVRAAELMLEGHAGDGPLYALGSGGLSYGVAACLGRVPRGDNLASTTSEPLAPADGPLLVVSGSCSGQTAEQIGWALDRGWEGIHLEVPAHRQVDGDRGALEKLRGRVLRSLNAGRNVVVYTALGGPESTRAGSTQAGDLDVLESTGRALAHVIRAGLEDADLRRVVVAGGDTSGRVMRALGATAAHVDTLLGVGTVICRIESRDPVVDGTQVLLKGGQTGRVDLLERVRHGDPGGSVPVPARRSDGTGQREDIG